MKTMYFFLMVVLCGVSAYGQDTTMVWRYAEIKANITGTASKGSVEMDNGDVALGWFKKVQLLEDDQGKAIKFKSPVDALNWLSVRGWELVNTYTTKTEPVLGTSFEYLHYVIRRREPAKKL